MGGCRWNEVARGMIRGLFKWSHHLKYTDFQWARNMLAMFIKAGDLYLNYNGGAIPRMSHKSRSAFRCLVSQPEVPQEPCFICHLDCNEIRKTDEKVSQEDLLSFQRPLFWHQTYHRVMTKNNNTHTHTGISTRCISLWQMNGAIGSLSNSKMSRVRGHRHGASENKTFRSKRH